MATSADAAAVKSLNTGPGRRRFVFKNFSERVNDIDIDVHRSLDQQSAEPSEGSCFIRDCLLEWRELNTAEDFIIVCEEIIPLVQTLPLVLLHKELILSKLISRLIMRARLSLEPILRLVVALSRDLKQDFLPFLQPFVNSLVTLLKDGAVREPDIIEQIFTSWSMVMMHLQKYLVVDIVSIFKVTTKLRYYPEDYIQEFMAEAMGVVLRNAHVDQQIKGTNKVMFEVAKNPTSERKNGVSSLLWNVMRGTSSRLHSKALTMLQILLDGSTFNCCNKYTQGSETYVEVIGSSIERMHESVDSNELKLVYQCLHDEILVCSQKQSYMHLRCLLTLLVSHVKLSIRRKTFPTLLYEDLKVNSDEYSILVLLKMLVEIFAPHSGKDNDEDSSLEIDLVLQLLLCVVEGLHSCGKTSNIDEISEDCVELFAVRRSSSLKIIKELLQKDLDIIDRLLPNIIRALGDLLETFEEEVVYLLVSLLEKLSLRSDKYNNLIGIPKDRVTRFQGYLRGKFSIWIQQIKAIPQVDSSIQGLNNINLALMWGNIRCCPHVLDPSESQPLLKSLIDELDRIAADGSDKALFCDSFDSLSQLGIVTQCLLGATLRSYFTLNLSESTWPEQEGKLLHLSLRHKSSSHVLVAISDFLESKCRLASDAVDVREMFNPDVQAGFSQEELINSFSANLSHPNKSIRVSTLKILCHYEHLNCKLCVKDVFLQSQNSNVLQFLSTIEETPFSVATSRTFEWLIREKGMNLLAGVMPDTCVTLALYGLLGVLHNRFLHIWKPATECLAFLVKNYSKLVLDLFISYLEKWQSSFSASLCRENCEQAGSSNNRNDLVGFYRSYAMPVVDSTPNPMVLSLLLQTMQIIPDVVNSKLETIIFLFLKFLGYATSDSQSLNKEAYDGLRLGHYNSQACKGKEWKALLKNWLNLLKMMKNLKIFDHRGFLKKVLLRRLLDDNDSETQLKVLDCLLLWKDEFLLPYSHHLKNIISTKDLKEELTRWSLSKEANDIDEQHRLHIVPVVIQLLIPKVRKLKTLGSRKHTGLLHRKTVLNFLAQLDASELPLFFEALLRPLCYASVGVGDDTEFFEDLPTNSDKNPVALFLKYFRRDTILGLTWKKMSSFLHVIKEIVGVFDDVRIKPYLGLLMGCVIRLLECCTDSLDRHNNSAHHSIDYHKEDLKMVVAVESRAAKTLATSSVKQFKEMRSLCLNIISFTLSKYPDEDFDSELWNAFFESVKPLIANFRQEGSSSEKPSSLFSCFGEMSKSTKLSAHLFREKNLVPDIFSILTIKTANKAITSFVLEFIENLLVVCSISEGGFTYQMLLLNLDQLIRSLHLRFYGDSLTKRKLVKCPGDRERRILKLLGKYIKGPVLAGKFVEIILLVFGKKFLDTDTGVVAIQIIRDLIPELDTQSTPKILDAVCPLLISAERGLRVPVCDLLGHLVETDRSMLSLSSLLRDLNATSVTDIGELDFDTIINAYGKLTVDFFNNVQADHAVMILSHCIYDMSSEEIILRHSAYRSLLSFVEHASSVLAQDKTSVSGGKMMIDDNSSYTWTGECVTCIIKKILVNQLGNAMSKPTSGQKEWVQLLQQMINKLPQVSELDSLKALCDQNAEVDFFNNIIHLQKHMRAKALYRFRDVVRKGCLSMGIVERVFVPMVFNILFDVQDGKGEHVRVACVDALASVSGQMEWKPYYALLKRCFREMNLRPDKQKVLLKLICGVLDQFHFMETCEDKNRTSVATSTSSLHAMSVLQKCTSEKNSKIQSTLQRNVLPKLQKFLDSDSSKVNVKISLAQLKILKLLPGDAKDSQLSSIIHHVSSFLKNRLESIRDEARTGLVDCLKEIGLEHLRFVIGILRSTLRRGFEMHVLGYTVHFILSSCFVSGTSGNLDGCLDDLLTVVENDILGDVAEEKEVDKIAHKMKETRKRKSLETLKIIAENVTFKSHAVKLLSPVSGRLQTHVTPKIKSKLEGMLEQIASGISCNPSVDQTHLFVFIYSLLVGGSLNDIGHGDHGSSSKRSLAEANVQSHCSQLVTVFALRVLCTGIDKAKRSYTDEKIFSELDPFVKLLTDCLNSKYEEVISQSLRCLTQIIKLPLPSLELLAYEIKDALLHIARSSYNTNSPLMESCLRLLALLLHHTKITLSTDQLQLLIQFPLFINLERNPSLLALSLLLSIIDRKLVVHEIYDIVNTVAELIVTSQVEEISKKCRQILLKFLLNYDIKEKRLQQHIDFLLKVLRYEHPSGRVAVLDMLKAIILNKKMQPVLDELFETFLVYLVQCLANDLDGDVKSWAGVVLKSLFLRVSQRSRNAIVEFGLSHYLGVKPKTWSIGAQVLGLIVEVVKKEEIKQHIPSIVPAIEFFLQSAPTVTESDPDCKEAMHHKWKAAYYSLVLFEKVLNKFSYLFFSKDLMSIWASICNLLSNPHVWLRQISCRLLNTYFDAVNDIAEGGAGKALDDISLIRPSRLFLIAASLCCHLKSLVVGDDQSDKIVAHILKNAICGLNSQMKQGRADYFNLDEMEIFHEAFLLLDTKKGNYNFIRFKSAMENKSPEDKVQGPRHILISNLLRRMGKDILQLEQSFEMKIILSTIKNISRSERFRGDCKEFEYLLLLPLYKICEGFAGKVIPDDVKQLASEVSQCLKSIPEIQYIEVYNQIRKDLKAKRDKRKQGVKVMAVVDPARNAKRKLKLAEKNKANKKRKVMTMKFGRWAH